MEKKNASFQNEMYCCNICFEERINKENGAKMCTVCQKPVCNTCYQGIQKKIGICCPWCQKELNYIDVNIGTLELLFSGELAITDQKVKFPCSLHFNSELIFYCIQCKQFLCKVCAGSNHRTHKLNKKLANKLLLQFESYKQSRNDILLGKYKSLTEEKIKELGEQLDTYFRKEQTEIKNILNNIIQKFRHQINKDYSVVETKQNEILEIIRENIRELKTKCSLTQKIKLHKKIKKSIEDLKSKNNFFEFNPSKYENCLTPKTLTIPLSFNLDYPLKNNTFKQFILFKNNDLKMLFTLNTTPEKYVVFAINMINIQKPFPVIWGITLYSKNEKQENFLNKKFIFSNNSQNSFEKPNEFSILLTTDMNDFITNNIKLNPLEKNKAIVDIDLFLRYFYFKR